MRWYSFNTRWPRWTYLIAVGTLVLIGAGLWYGLYHEQYLTVNGAFSPADKHDAKVPHREQWHIELAIPAEIEAHQYSFLNIADEDPNLALAGLRIEIERRLVQLAEANNIGSPRRGAGYLLRVLAERGILTREQERIRSDLIGTLNDAVHGAAVPGNTANLAMEVGPKLLASLDERIQGCRGAN